MNARAALAVDARRSAIERARWRDAFRALAIAALSVVFVAVTPLSA